MTNKSDKIFISVVLFILLLLALSWFFLFKDSNEQAKVVVNNKNNNQQQEEEPKNVEYQEAIKKANNTKVGALRSINQMITVGETILMHQSR